MPDEVSIRCKILKRTREERESNQFRLEIPAGYMKLLEWWVKKNPGILENAEITIRQYGTYTERAFRFFHLIRDEIVKAQSGKYTKSEAEQIKKLLKEDFGKGANVSLTTYTKRELWELVEGAMMILGEMPGVDLSLYQPQYNDLKKESYAEEKAQEEMVDIGLQAPDAVETRSNDQGEAPL